MKNFEKRRKNGSVSKFYELAEWQKVEKMNNTKIKKHKKQVRYESDTSFIEEQFDKLGNIPSNMLSQIQYDY